MAYPPHSLARRSEARDEITGNLLPPRLPSFRDVQTPQDLVSIRACRQPGARAFAPYYKAQWFDTRALCWRGVHVVGPGTIALDLDGDRDGRLDVALIAGGEATPDARRFFTERHAIYSRFIRAMRYPQGLRAFFLASPLVRSGLRILDAGCGRGALTLAVRDALVRRGCVPDALHAFDLTPAMLDRLRETLRRRGINDVELAEANVLHLDGLPASWRDYDLVVSASMLEYLPRDRFVDALAGLRGRLKEGDSFVLFVTRRNPLTRLLIGRWWASNLYTAGELSDAFERAGFSRFAFRSFPAAARYLSMWGHIVEATC